jgi:tripartite-type tricarboxylate transporter receptor subunit TctC
MRRATILAFALGATIIAAPSLAQQFPQQPIKVVVPFGAGGPTDLLTRIVGDALSKRLGQAVIIENRPGAGGNVGTQAVINAPADGYTLLVVSHTNAINATLYKSLKFNFETDIVPIAGMAQVPNVVEVTTSLPVTSIADLITYARQHPGALNFASTGHGTSAHLAGEMFKAATGVELVHVPYRASGPALTDLMAGRVQVMFDSIPASLPHIKEGKLRALAVMTKDRANSLPDVPTLSETLPDFVVSGWFGIGGPARLPATIVTLVNKQVNESLRDPDVQRRFNELSATPHLTSPEEYQQFMATETMRWGSAVKAAGVSID